MIILNNIHFYITKAMLLSIISQDLEKSFLSFYYTSNEVLNGKIGTDTSFQGRIYVQKRVSGNEKFPILIFKKCHLQYHNRNVMSTTYLGSMLIISEEVMSSSKISYSLH